MDGQGDVLLEASKAYDTYQLQGEHHSFSPREAYVQLCERFKCKPIGAVANMLSHTTGAWDAVEVVDLSRTYVGHKGAVPIIELCKCLSSLRRVNLSDNYLTNDATWNLAYMAMYHPTLREIELRGNSFISWSGAMCLMQALLRNARLTYVGLHKTGIPAHITEVLFHQARRNAVAMFVALGNVPKPSSDSNAVHLRAMRRYFLTVQESDGTMARSKIAESYREQVRILGRERDLCHYDADFFAALEARAPSDFITWEAFIVLVLLGAPVFSSHVEESLRNVFLEFNMDSTAVVEKGFVEAKSFAEVHQRLYGTVPQPADLKVYFDTLGLNDTHTVNWDEFLYVWYNRSPVEGSRPVGALLTPMPQNMAPLHY